MPDYLTTITQVVFGRDTPHPLPTDPGRYFRPWPSAPYYRLGRWEWRWRRLWLREGQAVVAVDERRESGRG